jgi:hypothetical protein
MVSDTLMEDLREEGSEFPEDLLFQAFGQPSPDVFG